MSNLRRWSRLSSLLPQHYKRGPFQNEHAPLTCSTPNILCIRNQSRFRLLYHGFYPRRDTDDRWKEVAYSMYLVGLIFSICFLEWPSKLFDWLMPAESTTPYMARVEARADAAAKSDDDDGGDAEDGKAKHVGFRDKKIIAYEDRIRQFSTPDKIFRYFATLRILNAESDTWEPFMTPEDFVRSLTPGDKQPEGLGLDQFKKFDPEKDQIDHQLSKDSIFMHFGPNGLISFSDYLFLLTVLSTPERQFVIAFKMFDANGDGTVDYSEFERVQAIVRSQTSAGKRHREHQAAAVKSRSTSGLATYFFGPRLDRKLTTDAFLAFYRQFQDELLRLEFDRFDKSGPDRISERDFCASLLAYAGLTEMHQRSMLRRVRKKFANAPTDGISFADYRDFFKFLRAINDVDTALTFYNIAGASIDQDTLKHVAKTVAKVKLSDHVVEVVFALFDENGDGQLTHKEFVAVMKNRMRRGLERPKDLGFVRKLTAVCNCLSQEFGLSTAGSHS